MKLHIDFETRSTVDLKKWGVARYADPLHTEVLCMAWGFDENVEVWFPDQEFPAEVIEHVRHRRRVVGHNVNFEFLIWNRVLAPAVGLPRLVVADLDCTMARARVMGLAGSLDGALKGLGAEIRKDADGHKLMLRMSKPTSRAGKPVVWDEDPANLARLGEYCRRDVLAEMELDRLLPDLTEREKKIWTLDLFVNHAGVPFDVEFVERADALVQVAKEHGNSEVKRITGSMVSTIGQVQRIRPWLATQGVEVADLTADTVTRLLEGEVPDPVRELLLIRQTYGLTSVGKFSKLLNWMVGGRAYMTAEYHGAHTGRWAGRGPQLQNLPKYDDDDPGQRQDVDWLYGMLKSHSVEEVHEAALMCGTPVMATLKLALRRSIKACAGRHRFVGADFSNIEGRVSAWLAGEDWKVKAFRDFDKGTGPDLYKLTASNALNIPLAEVTKSTRAVGKTAELSLQYQGGVGAIIRFCGTRTDPRVLADQAYSIADADAVEDATRSWKRTPTKVDPHIWIGLKILVDSWRRTNGAICEAWKMVEDLVRDTIARKPYGNVQHCNLDLSARRDEKFLYVRLPTSRVVAYPDPHMRIHRQEYLDKNGDLQVDQKMGPSFRSASGEVIDLYGGIIWENIIQATARDALAYSMVEKIRPALEESLAGEIVMHVHDEVLCEILEQSTFSKETLSELMGDQPLLPGCPIAVSAWEGREFVK